MGYATGTNTFAIIKSVLEKIKSAWLCLGCHIGDLYCYSGSAHQCCDRTEAKTYEMMKKLREPSPVDPSMRALSLKIQVCRQTHPNDTLWLPTIVISEFNYLLLVKKNYKSQLLGTRDAWIRKRLLITLFLIGSEKYSEKET